jgi:hypothetical protein
MRSGRSTFRPFYWFDHNERSTATVGYLVIAMTLYLSVAGNWNTGVIVNQKIKTQAIADAAAHGAATRLSSALNSMAMLNMLAMRARSAMVIYDACLATSIVAMITAVIVCAVNTARFIASCFALAPDFDALKQAIEAGIDAVTIGFWMSKFLKASRSDLSDTFDKVRDAQDDLSESLSSDINAQLKELENYMVVNGVSRTKVYVAHPDTTLYPGTGSNATDYLFTKADYLTRLLMISCRVAFADAQWLTVSDIYSPPTPKEAYKFPVLRGQKFFDNFRNSTVKNVIRVTFYASLLVAVPLHSIPSWGYKLKSQSFLSEWSGSDDDDRRMMQVIAMAERVDSQDTFMAKGFFKPINSGNSVVALAQAETSNTYDEVLNSMLGKIPLLSQMIAFPWRMWSSMGANYQGRLTKISPSLLREALGTNNDMKSALQKNMGGDINQSKETDVFLH